MEYGCLQMEDFRYFNMSVRGIFLYPPPRVSHPQRNVKINPKHLEAEKKILYIFRMLNPLRHTDAGSIHRNGLGDSLPRYNPYPILMY